MKRAQTVGYRSYNNIVRTMLLVLASCFTMMAGLVCEADAKSEAGGTSSYHEKLMNTYELLASKPFVYSDSEIDSYGQTALSLNGDARLYALWRVLYAYKVSDNREKFDFWDSKVMHRAQADRDTDLDLLARFMKQIYQNEQSGFTNLTESEWTAYLSMPNRTLVNIFSLERERQAQYFKNWAEAIDLGNALVVRLEADGQMAEALLAVARQTSAYNMIKVGDYDAYAGDMLIAARLMSSNGFFLQKMDMVFDLVLFAIQTEDVGLAKKFQSFYSLNVRLARVADLRPLDQQLCGAVASAGQDFPAVVSCLNDTNAFRAKVTSSTDAVQLRMLINSYAHLNDPAKAKFYYSKLQLVPKDVYTANPTAEIYFQAQLKYAEGNYATGFKMMDEFAMAYAQQAEQARVASIRDMYKALRKELDSKTEESRLLAKQVQMQRLLLGAAGVIALLLIVIVAGGAFWVMRMRRLHASLNEAHEHAEAANSAKSRFLAVMSHELRTPLNGVLGMAQALRKKDDLNPTQLEQVNILVDSGQTLLALLNDVLDMSRIEAGKVELAPSPASLKDTIERVINTYSSLVEAKGLVLRYDLDPSATPVMLFDVLRVYQCLSNLVSNAVKFTEKGTVRILVSAEERRGGGYVVRCEVRDTGIGMTKAVMERLFEAYSQADAMTVRKYGGSGLGLSISRRLAELMGGALTVTSQEGVGSSFVMTFKAEAVAEEAPHAEAPSQTILAEEDENLPGMHILLVDDHPVNRKVARLFLEPFGFIITEAADGQEALDCDMSRFDLVLMDLNMPKMGGLEATRLFRAGEAPGRHVPIVALTADAMKDQVEGCYAAGMDAHIAKPIIMDTLIGTVARLLHLHDGVEDGAEQDAEDAPRAVTAS